MKHKFVMSVTYRLIMMRRKSSLYLFFTSFIFILFRARPAYSSSLIEILHVFLTFRGFVRQGQKKYRKRNYYWKLPKLSVLFEIPVQMQVLCN